MGLRHEDLAQCVDLALNRGETRNGDCPEQRKESHSGASGEFHPYLLHRVSVTDFMTIDRNNELVGVGICVLH